MPPKNYTFDLILLFARRGVTALHAKKRRHAAAAAAVPLATATVAEQ